jgi:hypothetical protein
MTDLSELTDRVLAEEAARRRASVSDEGRLAHHRRALARTRADRAVFIEKGGVRCVGPAVDLLERDDLARAVFLGGEHDMPLVMSINDRVCRLEVEKVISCATPAEVRNDPLVIAPYLGVDDRAIARCGSASA